MKLSEAAALLDARVVPANAPDRVLTRLSCHPERVTTADVFGLFPEYFNYNQWFDEAAGRAAAVRVQPTVVVAREPIPSYRGVVLQVPDPRRAFAHLARAFHHRPDAHLPVVGVTGTNGKTTTSHLVAHLVERLGEKAGCMGTLGTFLNDEAWRPGDFTTDLALPTMATLARFRAAGAAAVAMEVSSHGLALDRVAGLAFRVGVLTNVARDHLDFHGSQEHYVSAKERLFRELDPAATAVLNADDPLASRFREATRACVVTYGWQPGADWSVETADLRPNGATVSIRTGGERLSFTTRLVGRFQIANILAAAAAVSALGYDRHEVLAAVEDFEPVSGRMETIPLRSGATAIIDYAHNPDGLENLLTNCRAMRPRRILLVFGCGGDRDRGKRPLMGAIAERGADRIWVTSDNPRTEPPLEIIGDILRGLPASDRLVVEPNRAMAIAQAWGECEPGDLLLVAGKGHEDYQLIGTMKQPFSDREEVRRLEAEATG